MTNFLDNIKKKISSLRKTIVAFNKRVCCRVFGHRINVYLMEYTHKKTCTRCGETVWCWWVMTVDEVEEAYKANKDDKGIKEV